MSESVSFDIGYASLFVCEPKKDSTYFLCNTN